MQLPTKKYGGVYTVRFASVTSLSARASQSTPDMLALRSPLYPEMVSETKSQSL